MKRLTKKCILPLLLAALCLLPAGCWSGETPEDGDSLDGLIGAEGLNGKEDEEQGTPLTSFALPLLSGELVLDFTLSFYRYPARIFVELFNIRLYIVLRKRKSDIFAPLGHDKRSAGKVRIKVNRVEIIPIADPVHIKMK